MLFYVVLINMFTACVFVHSLFAYILMFLCFKLNSPGLSFQNVKFALGELRICYKQINIFCKTKKIFNICQVYFDEFVLKLAEINVYHRILFLSM